MFIAGNWKMYTDLTTAKKLAREVVDGLVGASGVRIAICPPFISLHDVSEIISHSPVRLGAQTMHEADEGAFTGEVSATMLRSIGCRYVILGHSERRQYFGEQDETINRKVKQAVAHELIPILCVGEVLEERQAGREQEVVRRQVEAALDGVSVDDPDALVVAYEPVWAIGTGETASPEQAQEMHAFIRGLLTERYGEETARAIHVLYGGSVKPGNAAELFAQPDVDGGLIGGASLKAADFLAIVHAGEEQAG